MKALFLTDKPPLPWPLGEYIVAPFSEELLLAGNYDIAVITPDKTNCSFEVASKLHDKIVMCWPDCVMTHRNSPVLTPYGTPLLPHMQWWKYAELGVTTVIHDQFCGNFYTNCHGLGYPQDPHIFNAEPIEETIDVSFIGETLTIPERIQIIQRLQEDRIDVWAGNATSPQDRAKIHKQSKICINLQTGHGQAQRMPSAFEIAACKKFMMCTNGFVLDDFFERGDYASIQMDSLVSQIKYYLTHKDERLHCAERLHNTYLERHTPEKFWEYVLDVKIKKPPRAVWTISGMRGT